MNLLPVFPVSRSLVQIWRRLLDILRYCVIAQLQLLETLQKYLCPSLLHSALHQRMVKVLLKLFLDQV